MRTICAILRAMRGLCALRIRRPRLASPRSSSARDYFAVRLDYFVDRYLDGFGVCQEVVRRVAW